jgi:dihydrofolate reductase
VGGVLAGPRRRAVRRRHELDQEVRRHGQPARGGWQNTEIVGGDVAQKLTDIKTQDGGDIAMPGSATTVRWLLREGLLDELNLLVHSIVVGDGLARLLPPDEPSIPLQLQTFKTGVLTLSYTPSQG